MPPSPPRLRAGIRLYRHQGVTPVSGVVHYGGRYATALDRKSLAGLVQVAKDRPDAYTCKMRLHSGMTLLWDLTDVDAGGRTLTFDGALSLRVATFDRYHLYLADAMIDDRAPGTYPLPAGAGQVAITALEPLLPDSGNQQDQAIGWQADTLLIQINPIAFLGEGVTVRLLNPTYIRRGKNMLACGLVIARNVIAQNWVTMAADQRRRGWIDTFFPGTTRSIGVSVRSERQGLQGKAAPEQAASVEFIGPAQDGGSLRVSSQLLTAPKVTVDASGNCLWYDLPVCLQGAQPAGPQRAQPPARVRVQPQPGWLLDGIFGQTVDAEQAQSLRPGLSTGLCAALPTVRPLALTCVELT